MTNSLFWITSTKLKGNKKEGKIEEHKIITKCKNWIMKEKTRWKNKWKIGRCGKTQYGPACTEDVAREEFFETTNISRKILDKAHAPSRNQLRSYAKSGPDVVSRSGLFLASFWAVHYCRAPASQLPPAFAYKLCLKYGSLARRVSHAVTVPAI